jgi:hypothetical protein
MERDPARGHVGRGIRACIFIFRGISKPPAVIGGEPFFLHSCLVKELVDDGVDST